MFRTRNEQVNEILRDTSPYIFESATATISSKMYEDGSEAIVERRSIEFWEEDNRRAAEDYFRSRKDPTRFQVDDVLVYMSSVDDESDHGAYDMMDDPGVDPSSGATSSEELRRSIEEDERERSHGVVDSSGVAQIASGMAGMASPSTGVGVEVTGQSRILRSSYLSPGGGTEDPAESAPRAPSKDDDFPEECEHDDSLVVSHHSSFYEDSHFSVI